MVVAFVRVNLHIIVFLKLYLVVVRFEQVILSINLIYPSRFDPTATKAN